MASKADTLKGIRALHGAAVTLAIFADGCADEDAIVGTETGRVWSGAPTDALLYRSTVKALRARHGMTDHRSRDFVWVMLTGGRMARAEVNLETLQGYGVVAWEGSGIRHTTPDADLGAFTPAAA